MTSADGSYIKYVRLTDAEITICNLALVFTEIQTWKTFKKTTQPLIGRKIRTL